VIKWLSQRKKAVGQEVFYNAEGGKITINHDEAEVVKQCFNLYLESSGLIETVTKLNKLGLRTKHFVSAKGRVYEAKPWIAKQFHRVLNQPIYSGKEYQFIILDDKKYLITLKSSESSKFIFENSEQEFLGKKVSRYGSA